MKEKDIETEINAFFNEWGFKELENFFRDAIPIIELYDPENDKEIIELVGKDDELNVRLLRTVYLMSKFAENHTAKLYVLNTKFKGLWKKIEKHGVIENE